MYVGDTHVARGERGMWAPALAAATLLELGMQVPPQARELVRSGEEGSVSLGLVTSPSLTNEPHHALKS